MRDNIETHHYSWFSTAEKMCETIGTVPSIPRRCQRQTHRDNVPADTPSQYYCRTISIPLVDYLLSEMKSRFSSHQKTAILGLSLVPSAMITMSAEEFTTNTQKLAELYSTHLPSPESFSSELDCWNIKWKQQNSTLGPSSLPSTPLTTLRQTSSMYPNIRVLLVLLCTLPVTSCSAERSFSTLKRTKTPFRSSMSTERLTNLSLLSIHRDIDIDISEAVDEFS